ASIIRAMAAAPAGRSASDCLRPFAPGRRILPLLSADNRRDFIPPLLCWNVGAIFHFILSSLKWFCCYRNNSGEVGNNSGGTAACSRDFSGGTAVAFSGHVKERAVR